MAGVFLSYSHKDRGFVEQLARDLRANGVTPWYDRWEMLPGDSLVAKIGTALLKNDYFVIILSPNSVSSQWVQRELAAALHRELQKRQVKVIPVVIRDCEVPTFLRDKVYADFRKDYREGLGGLLRALGSKRAMQKIQTSLPTSAGIRTIWDNVIGDNLTLQNIVE